MMQGKREDRKEEEEEEEKRGRRREQQGCGHTLAVRRSMSERSI